MGPNIHNLMVAASPGMVLLGILLVERRGRRKPLDPTRQIQIRTLLESMPDAVILVDAARKVVDANRIAARLSGLKREEMIGTPLNDLAQRMDGEVGGNVLKIPQNLIADRALEGEKVAGEHRMVNHPVTGERVDLLISASPIRNDKGQIQGALLIARDVSELTQLQQRLSDIDRHQAIGHVAAGIAHDFNNTLQTISQAVAVLQISDRPMSERKVFLDMIQTAVRRGAEVISRIRDYVRSGASVTSEVDVRGLIEDAVQLTQPLWQAAGTSVKRELSQVPPVTGNAADLRRVFTNLIINSVQAMAKGGELTLGCEQEDRAVHAWIRDTGPGIPQEIRKQIFNPYFTTKPGGTGLGLSGAQKILLELGGNISFQSEPGRGTQFDLYIPRVQKKQELKSA